MVDEDKPVFEDESTDFYDEFKDRMRQEPLKSVLSQNAKSSRPIGGILAVFGGVFLAALILWYIIGKYVSEDTSDNNVAPPVIMADADPVKERPSDVGGMEIIGRDKSVYNRMNQEQGSVPERIIARQEVPKPVAVTEELKVQVQEIVTPVVVNKEVTNSNQNVSPSTPKALETVASVQEQIVEKNIVNVQPVARPEVKEIAVKVQETPKTPVVEKKVEQKTAISSQDWKIQILSSRDKNSVEKAWLSMKAKNSDLLSNVPHEVVSADLGSRGVFYRLRVGSFADRKLADDLCSKLKSRKVDCFVIK